MPLKRTSGPPSARARSSTQKSTFRSQAAVSSRSRLWNIGKSSSRGFPCRNMAKYLKFVSMYQIIPPAAFLLPVQSHRAKAEGNRREKIASGRILICVRSALINAGHYAELLPRNNRDEGDRHFFAIFG